MNTEQQEITEATEEEQAEESRANAEQTNGAEPLFAENERSDFRSRWEEVQAGFVDEPKQSVERADALVSDAVERMTAGFTSARTRLEEQWAQGEDASTEDLRVALTRYRSFFNRVLDV
jgi:hypothetical protein